jgi:diguanylate cyclase (GGDEF)-like protein/PAS domain S-box-containing protein
MSESGRRRPERWFPLTCVVLALATLVWSVLTLSGSESATTALLSNVGLLAAAGAAAVRCAMASRHSVGRMRWAWRVFGLACASWAAGQCVWTHYESVLGREVPFPSLADVGYLGFVPLTTIGLLALPTAPTRLASLLRTVLDGLIIATSVLFISWATIVGPLLRQGSDSGLAQAIILAYPLGDVVLITILLFSVTRSRHISSVPPWTLGLLSAGLASFAFGDSGFAYLTLTDSYASGSLVDLGWFAGFVLIFLAAARPTTVVTSRRDAASGAHDSTMLLPYAPVLVALVVWSLQLASGSVRDLLAWIMVAVVFLVVVRQVLTLLENISLTRNLEERVRTRTAELHRSERRFRSLVQNSSDVITVVDVDGVVTYQSHSASQVFGYVTDDVVGTSFVGLVHPAHRAALVESLERAAASPGEAVVIESSMWHRDERWCQTETVITNLLDDPSVGGLVLNTRDVSERQHLQNELVHQALHDPLTNLANRVLFKNRLEHALSRSNRHHRPLAVLFLDLDGFKQINDSLGHASGDEVLIEVAARLRLCVRECDTVARLGGDEFAIMLEEVAGDSEVLAVADRISEALRAPFRVGAHELFAAASIGIALADGADGGEESADDLLRNADLAMYRAKADGDGGHCWYESSMHRAMVDRLELEADLRHALDREELHLVYQPIIDLGTGALLGSEALLRWQHPTRGAVSPAEFVPVAESCGLIRAIGEWVLRTACLQLREWGRDLDFPLFVSVNLSGHQVRQADLVDVVMDALRQADLDPCHLVLEMTESILIEQSDETLANLRRLKDLGVKLAVDDFGTGYSSLSYLHRFPVDIIKIDRSFVDRLSAQDGEAGLAASIVHIGHAMQLTTVAEGIEEPYQYDVLKRMGCDRGQGYLMARPLEQADFAALLGVARLDDDVPAAS